MILNKELRRKIFCVCFISLAAFVLTGCMGGGGGGGSSSGVGGVDLSSGSGSGTTDSGQMTFTSFSATEDTGSATSKIHNPEPSSMLLLGSGLLGMLIAKRKKGKK